MITPKEAQTEYEGSAPIAGGFFKPWRKARLTRTIRGKMFQWRKGGIVKARHDRGSSYTIQRAKWRGSLVPLANVLAGVPRSVIEFLP